MQQVQVLSPRRWNGTERKRLEAAVETLTIPYRGGENIAELAHDARNMMTALGLYCDLLEEPGVLTDPFTHYGGELRLVAEASRRLVDQLAALGKNGDAGKDFYMNGRAGRGHDLSQHEAAGRRDLSPAALITNLAAELLAIHNLLAALAGPAITVTVDAEGGAWPVRMSGEDLIRVLVNLVKNASEAMSGGGRIEIHLRELDDVGGTAEALALSIEDTGPGIPEENREKIFAASFTTRAVGDEGEGGRDGLDRGLGLSIVCSIVEAAGGRIRAANREAGGARFVIELPVRKAS